LLKTKNYALILIINNYRKLYFRKSIQQDEYNNEINRRKENNKNNKSEYFKNDDQIHRQEGIHKINDDQKRISIFDVHIVLNDQHK